MKIMTLNIEASKHLDKFPQVVRTENPDVLCLQEVCEQDLEHIAKLCDLPQYHFSRKFLLSKEHHLVQEDSPWGVAFFSREKMENVREVYYRRASPPLSETQYTTIGLSEDRQCAHEGVILIGEYNGYTVGTLHFTWSYVTATQLQIKDAHAVMKVTEEIPEFILCGDFNVPRIQNECYEIFTQRFIDAVPHSYVMSVDKNIHINGDKIDQDLMVDYIFYTVGYSAQDVRLIDGVSDHMAVVGTIDKK